MKCYYAHDNKKKNTEKKIHIGNSLAVQWLGLCAFTESRSCKSWGAAKKKKKKKIHIYLEVSWMSPLDFKEIQPVYPKGDQSWVFIGRTDAEAETPILCHLMRRADSLEKLLMVGGIGGRRRRGR